METGGLFSTRRGSRTKGGEGKWDKTETPEGLKFKTHFFPAFTFCLRESESWVQFLVIFVYFCQLRIKYHVIRASAETCYECLRGENKQKLEVLSFEKAWDKIEKDIFGRDQYL